MKTIDQRLGRGAARVASRLRQGIAGGLFNGERYLPPIRNLSKDYGVAPETVRRAMKLLVTEKLIVSEPRHGYRLLHIANFRESGKRGPIAFVLCGKDDSRQWSGFIGHLLTVLQQCAANRGEFVIGVDGDNRAPAEIVELLRTTGVTEVLLDANPNLFLAVKKLRLPTTMIEDWHGSPGVDTVNQDNFGGALQVADYLAAQGHKRIAWLGPVCRTIPSTERWGGIVSGLRRHNIELPPELMVDSYEVRDNGTEALSRILSSDNRPTAIIALWQRMAVHASHVINQMGLRIGQDVEIVGWCAEEQFEAYASSFKADQVPATVVWKIQDLAETVFERLVERRNRPDLRPLRMTIQTTLRLGTAKA